MPVPVPVHEAHRVVKPKNILQGDPQSAAPESVGNDTLHHVIHPTCQPPGAEAGFYCYSHPREIRPNWQLFSPYYPWDIPSRPGQTVGFLDLSHRLTAADEVAISSLADAKASHSPPVLGPANSRMTMGLQHFTERREIGVVGAHRKLAMIESTSRPPAENPNQSDEFNSCGQVPFSTWEFSRHLGSDVAEGIRDGLVRPVTPFADFVDRIVATEVGCGNDHLVRSSPLLCQPVDAPPCQEQQQQPGSIAPLSNPSYIRAYRAVAEPLSEWMADFVWAVCSDGAHLPRRFVGLGTHKVYENKPSSLAKSIDSVLCSTLLQPSAIVLALWYITRLPVLFEERSTDVNLTSSELEFRKELYGEGKLYSTSGERGQLEAVAPFRIALLGCMLANKWLDDHTFSNKTWHSISDVPIQSINRLELAALSVLGHDLSVAPKAWGVWLEQLHRSLVPTSLVFMRDSYAVARKMVVDLARLHNQTASKVPAVATEQPVFSALLVVDFDTLDDPYQTASFDPFEIDLDEDGPLREEYIPKRRSTILKSSTSVQMNTVGMSEINIPRLSDWAPHVDPALLPSARPGGVAFLPPVGPAGNTSFGGQLHPAYPHVSSWDAQTEVKRNAVPFLPRQPDFPHAQFSHGFIGQAFAFPVHSACSSTGHSRTSSSAAGSSTQEALGPWHSHPQTHVCGNDACFPIPCSRYAEYSSAFSHCQGSSGYFQSMWLKA